MYVFFVPRDCHLFMFFFGLPLGCCSLLLCSALLCSVNIDFHRWLSMLPATYAYITVYLKRVGDDVMATGINYRSPINSKILR